MDSTKANQDIRQAAKEAGVTLWKLASFMGKSEATITRMLRSELSEETKEELMKAISQLKGK